MWFGGDSVKSGIDTEIDEVSLLRAMECVCVIQISVTSKVPCLEVSLPIGGLPFFQEDMEEMSS